MMDSFLILNFSSWNHNNSKIILKIGPPCILPIFMECITATYNLNSFLMECFKKIFG